VLLAPTLSPAYPADAARAYSLPPFGFWEPTMKRLS